MKLNFRQHYRKNAHRTKHSSQRRVAGGDTDNKNRNELKGSILVGRVGGNEHPRQLKAVFHQEQAHICIGNDEA